MKFNSKILLIIMLIAISIVVSGCKTVLNLTYNPLSNPDNRLGHAPPVRVKLLNFEDARESKTDATLIGKRQKREGGARLDVYSSRPCPEIIREALQSELTRSGHLVVDENEDIVMKGEINKFWVRSDATFEQWEVMSRVDLHIEVIHTSSGKSRILGPYHGGDIVRMFDEPADAILTRTLDTALGKVMQHVSSDIYLEGALKKIEP
jgi:hypothetical protein